MRVCASQASIHCPHWLHMSFAFACKLEAHMQKTKTEPPLIKSSMRMDGESNLAKDIVNDDAFLRTHFCMQAEHALGAARRGGMWSGGNHLVLVAWLACPPKGQNDSGVRIFARAITEHSIADHAEGVMKARLVTPQWKASIEKSGHDSVIECARLFERALHERNISALEDEAGAADTILARWEDAGIVDEQGRDAAWAQELAESASLPHVPRHSFDVSRVAALATGPAAFDVNVVPSIDAATNLSLQRVRVAQQTATVHASLLVVQTKFEHGCACAVVALPTTEADLKPTRDRLNEGSLVRQSFAGREALLERLAMFAD